MNILLFLIILLIFLFLMQVATEIRNFGDADSTENNIGNILRKLEDNTISVNERLELIMKHEEDKTINNINLETNVKMKIGNELLKKLFVEVRRIKRMVEDSNKNVIDKILEIENRLLNGEKNSLNEENLAEELKTEKNKEIKFEEIKEKIDKLKEDLNIKNPEEREW